MLIGAFTKGGEKMIEWLEQSDSMGFIGLISSCERFRIREHSYPNFRWCLWEKKADPADLVGTPARTLEECKKMAEQEASR